MRKPFIAGNWKMNTDCEGATALAKGLKERIGDVSAVDVAVCPPFVYLKIVAGALSASSIAVGLAKLLPYNEVSIRPSGHTVHRLCI